ncbi:MAG: hypothetical protein Kow00105_16530 [Phycisphaeraceae bacterium]
MQLDAAPDPNPAMERVSKIAETFSSRELISPHWLFITAGLVLLLLSVVSIVHLFRHRHNNPHPLWVYLTAARIAGLGLLDQWVLFRIARRQGLATPLTLLLSPGTFDHHVKACVDARSAWRRETLRRRAQRIRERLFSDLSPTA